jgi:hypothetical protein
MFIKKIIMGIFLLSLLNGCAQNTAFLGPLYTLGTTGNSLQAGISYGSNQIVSKVTGKTAGENIQEILQPKTNDSELRKLLKKRITQTRKKLDFKKINTLPNNKN